MLIYIAIFIILLLPVFLDNSRLIKRNAVIYYFIFPFFLCFGYMNGSDWRNYEIDFNQINSFSDVLGYGREKGYVLFGYFFKRIGLNFWQYAITLKLIGYYIFLYFLKKYSERSIFGIVFLFGNFALFLWIDHPARNFCAIIIYLFSYKYIYEKSFVKYCLICLLASFFHLSALFLIPIYFFNKKYNTSVYVLLIFISIVLFFVSHLMLPYIVSLTDSLFFFSRFNSYLNDLYIGKSMNVFRFGFNVVILILAIIKKKDIEQYKYGTLILNLSIIYLLIFSVGNINIILFRFNFYYIAAFTMLISYLLMVMQYIYKNIFKFAVILISFYYLHYLTTKDFRYTPYTHYICYSFKERPTYYYRSKYNFDNSPY